MFDLTREDFHGASRAYAVPLLGRARANDTCWFRPDVEFNTPLDSRGGGPADDTGGGIFAAVEEQLGLKLERSHGVLLFIVIDRVEQPVEN